MQPFSIEANRIPGVLQLDDDVGVGKVTIHAMRQKTIQTMKRHSSTYSTVVTIGVFTQASQPLISPGVGASNGTAPHATKPPRNCGTAPHATKPRIGLSLDQFAL